MSCPICQQPNQPAASFCVECGAALALNNALDDEAVSASAIGVPPVTAAEEHTGPRFTRRSPLAGSQRGVAVRLGTALLVVALVVNWFAQSSAQADGNRYRLALQAEQQQRWHRAADLLGPLAQQQYSQASLYYRIVAQHVADWDSAHQRAAAAEAAGATATAAAYYRQASLLEPGYSDAAAKLTQLRPQGGQVIYREPDGLYVATADGETELTLPGTGTNFDLLTISADSRLICYTYDTDFGTESTRNLVVGDVGHRYFVVQSFLFSGSVPPRLLDAAFLDNGAGLLFVVGGQFGTSAAADTPLELYYLDLIGDSGLREIGLAQQVARPTPGDSAVYYIPTAGDDSILAYDPASGLAQPLVHEAGRVISLAMVAPQGNPYLLYALFRANHLRFYSRALLTGTSTMLGDEPVTAADPGTVQVQIAISPHDGQAIAILVGAAQGWRLQVAPAAATRLSDSLLTPLGPLAHAQYSPDGRRVLLTGGVGGTLDLSDYLILDRNGQPLRSGSYFGPPTAAVGWLADSRHFYVYTWRNIASTRPIYLSCRRGDLICARATLIVVDGTSGVNHSLAVGSQTVSNPATLLASLPDGQSMIYVAADGLYIAAPGSPAAKVIDGATGVWPYSP